MPISINTVARDIRSESSAGGSRVWLTEARKLVGTATADGRLTAREKDVLEKVVSDGNLTRSAASHIRGALESTPSSASTRGPFW